MCFSKRERVLFNSFLVILSPDKRIGMDYEGKFILRKEVNWSLLNRGLNIPISLWILFGAWNPEILVQGVTKRIKIIVGDEMFNAILTNQNFNRSKYPDHSNMIQIRYDSNKFLKKKLQAIFQKSYNHFSTQRELIQNRHKPLPLSEDIHEYIRFILRTILRCSALNVIPMKNTIR